TLSWNRPRPRLLRPNRWRRPGYRRGFPGPLSTLRVRPARPVTWAGTVPGAARRGGPRRDHRARPGGCGAGWVPPDELGAPSRALRLNDRATWRPGIAWRHALPDGPDRMDRDLPQGLVMVCLGR